VTPTVTTYHQRVAEEKRALIVGAATALFLELGYDRTSLARIAERSGVSRATLFKQFPTKAALFDAIVSASWATAKDEDPPPAGDVVGGLPELADAQFAQGKLPAYESVRRYLLTEHEAGTVRIDDAELAATQFLGMISNYVFWPTLLVPGWEVTAARVTQVVDEAVRTCVARYGVV
jgi:TetR/AcrR family transcriptional regulator, regulator of autoinduction and epiphytic fitness